MEAKRLYELLDGKMPLKECGKLSPYCEESYYGWPVKGIILDGQYADLIGDANIEYMKNQDYSCMLLFRPVYRGWNVTINTDNLNPSYIDNLVNDIYYMLEICPFLDDDIYYRMEDEKEKKLLWIFLTENLISLRMK